MMNKSFAALAGVILSLSTITPAHAGEKGKGIYEQNCAICHQAGLMGAPRLGDKGAWKARIAKGIPSLTANVINGLRAMPARGGCSHCTDEDLKLAIKYMVERSK